jgi:radical SAM protein with 4Fe4S-binding SPASM domain
MGVIGRIKNHYARRKPLDKGFHTFRGEAPDGRNYRLHLRIEEGGGGILVINASKVIHLNQTAAEYAKLMIDGLDERGVAGEMASRYRVKKQQAAQDFRAFREKIMLLVESDEVCPVAALDMDRIEPFSMPVSAPYRMDLALTHRCALNCGHCYAGGPRETGEMDTGSWKKVLDKMFDIGVPHVCFTGGEATERDDLPELIAHAEDLGLVTGLLTNGCRLSDASYVKKLVEEGLDHVQITIESHDQGVHDAMVQGEGFDKTVKGVGNALAEGLYTVTNTTITRKNVGGLVDTVKFLRGLGVERFAMNGIIHAGRGEKNPDAVTAEELADRLDEVVDVAAGLGMSFIWYTPTRYCEFDPVEHELGMKRCTAGHFNMCVEPDGSVLPCQSYFEPVGDILKDDWDRIWNHQLLVKMRDRDWVDDECRECDQLDLCGGGCPLEKDGEGPLCTESLSNF